MADYLPPLTALRAFEAAARHMSFAAAADELSVTPAALSFQIKSLEAHLGAPVFRRLNRAVELTELGRMLRPGLTEGFDGINRTWRAARRQLDDTTLTVTAGPAFTAKWLAPRMFRFAQDNPDIELRFSASLKIMDFERDEVDLAIRFGPGNDEGLFSEVMLEDWVTPMMHPDLARSIKTPEDLLEAQLIHDDNVTFLETAPSWETWFRMAGLERAPDHGPRFSQADHAIDLALERGGVVLGRGSIAEHALRDGRLVAPFQPTLNIGGQYRFVCPPGTENRPAVARFRTWVMSELETLHKLTQERAPVAIT